MTEGEISALCIILSAHVQQFQGVDAQATPLVPARRLRRLHPCTHAFSLPRSHAGSHREPSLGQRSGFVDAVFLNLHHTRSEWSSSPEGLYPHFRLKCTCQISKAFKCWLETLPFMLMPRLWQVLLSGYRWSGTRLSPSAVGVKSFTLQITQTFLLYLMVKVKY